MTPIRTPRSGVDGSLLRRMGLLVTAAWVLLDHGTKFLAVELLSPAGSQRVELPGFFSFELTYNPGGAWSTKAPWWFFLIVTVIVATVVIRALPDASGLWQATAYGLLLAGAIGNALDRVFRTGDPGDPRYLHGHVVDFVASAKFPTFNVADIAITFGFALLVLTAYRHDQRTDDAAANS